MLRLSTPESRRADAQKNRDRLITEARELFAAGEGTVTLDAIARQAGVGIGTLYRHFPTRETLVEAVYRHELDMLETETDGLLAAHAGSEALRLWMDRYARFVATKHAMHDALRVALTPRENAVSDTRARITAAVARFLAAGARDGSLRADLRADDVAVALAGMVLGATASVDPMQMGRLLDLLLAGLRS